MKHGARDSTAAAENECAKQVSKQKILGGSMFPYSWRESRDKTLDLIPASGEWKATQQTEEEIEFFIRYSDNVVDVLKMQTQGANFAEHRHRSRGNWISK